MSNLLLMAIFDCLKDDFADITSLLLVVVGFLDNPIKELSAAHFFRHEVVVFGFVKDIIQPDNVWMLEILENRDFILERNLVFVCKLGLGDNLDGKGLAGLFVRSFLDLGKGAFTELW
jgi:uncharacterized protein YlaN (UPF0358 family)